MTKAIGIVMAGAWLLVVGCAAHILTEHVADRMDNLANTVIMEGNK